MICGRTPSIAGPVDHRGTRLETKNPYQTPQSEVAGGPEEVQPVRVFATSGRIGRVRYIAYSIGLSMLIGLVAGIVSAIAARLIGDAANAFTLLGWAAIVAISIMLTIQRCHDFNTTGWLSLLGLIPLVNLIFWFIPGTDGPNRFGAKTPPNSVLTVIAACIVPTMVVIGILAAIALPAYQEYVKRAATQPAR